MEGSIYTPKEAVNYTSQFEATRNKALLRLGLVSIAFAAWLSFGCDGDGISQRYDVSCQGYADSAQSKDLYNMTKELEKNQTPDIQDRVDNSCRGIIDQHQPQPSPLPGTD